MTQQRGRGGGGIAAVANWTTAATSRARRRVVVVWMMLLFVVMAVVIIVDAVDAAAAAAVANSADHPDDDNESNNDDDGDIECGLWLGPSHIKEVEEHGFGLGMFTGRRIPKGTLSSRELLVPVYDYDDGTGDRRFHETPLREYVWNGQAYKALVLEVELGMVVFLPGLAAIAPCTSNNFNLELVHEQDQQVTFDQDDLPVVDRSEEEGQESNSSETPILDVHRTRDPTAGSFGRYHVRQFRAVRDIEAGEELVVECSDDDFDGAPHSKVRFDPNDDQAVMCLDDKVEERPTSSHGATAAAGNGAFAKRPLAIGTVVLSSPAVPVHKSVLEMKHFQPSGWQLLMNYCFGHPDSELLWLPFGTIFNSVNHADVVDDVNVKVQWHHQRINKNNASRPISTEPLSRRRQYHHPELLDFSVERVADTHGKGLVLDLVATRNIEPGEELLLDYGPAWRVAWKMHRTKFWSALADLESNDKVDDSSSKGGSKGNAQPSLAEQDRQYVPAMLYNKRHANDTLRTITEQRRNPYPPNLITACRFQKDWIDDEDAEDYDMVQYHSWNEQTDHHTCLLPCLILERVVVVVDPPGRQGDGAVASATTTSTYTAKLIDKQHDNESIEWECHIFKRFEYIYTDIPREGIEFIEKVYRSDTFLERAFRHFIQVSDDMYPAHWKTSASSSATSSSTTTTTKALRRRNAATTATTSSSGGDAATVHEKQEEETFKRKKPLEPLFDREEMKRKKLAVAEEL